jgi:hypothetical protein
LAYQAGFLDVGPLALTVAAAYVGKTQGPFQ